MDEFYLFINAAIGETGTRICAAKERGDKKQERYFRGVYRGLEIALESFRDFKEIETIQKVQASHQSSEIVKEAMPQ